MKTDWRNAFGNLMCREICDGAGPGICDGVPSTCSSNKVISYWPSYRSSVSCIGPRPWVNTADRGPVTGIIRNHFINNIMTVKLEAC